MSELVLPDRVHYSSSNLFIQLFNPLKDLNTIIY